MKETYIIRCERSYSNDTQLVYYVYREKYIFFNLVKVYEPITAFFSKDSAEAYIKSLLAAVSDLGKEWKYTSE